MRNNRLANPPNQRWMPRGTSEGEKSWVHTRHRGLLVPFSLGVGLTLALLRLLAGSPTPASAHAPKAEPVVNASSTYSLYLPLIAKGNLNFAVTPQDRQASLAFFNSNYRAAEGVSIGWTGSQSTCNEGTTSPAFRQAMLLRINYYRAMAGVPGIVDLSDDYNRKAQKAALMMSVNNQLSHSPPETWACYSADGKQAAGSSSLFLGAYSINAIDGYMADYGGGNNAAGHRRWILFPPTQLMGSGDIPPGNGYLAANALWVFDRFGPRPATREEFVAWPPPGYIPYQVVFPRWSFAYDGADFGSASVSMTSEGIAIPVSLYPIFIGYGENTMVWDTQISFATPPAADKIYTVSINNVMVNGSPRNFSYEVIVIDPGAQAAMAASGREAQLGMPPKLR